MLLNQNVPKIYAIFTAQCYSFAIIKVEGNTYFFNSHSCTPQGRHSKLRTKNDGTFEDIGFSSIIRFTNNSMQEINNNINGANSISEFILKLLLPNKHANNLQLFSLTRIECFHNTNAETLVTDLEESINNMSINNSYILNNRDSLQNSICINNNNELLLETQTQVIDTDQNQPNVTESIEKIINHDKKMINFQRETTKPLYSNAESRLEEMSFIKLFPYGINGYREPREGEFRKVTPAAYGKARVMSVDSRFQNIEYLFYVLSMIEQEQIVSTINVCSKLRSNQERVNNLHVYTKGLRGNYGKKIYTR